MRADAWMLCDGPVHQSRPPLLYFGARGVTNVELTVYGPIRALHSGHYGNWAPNPIVTLTHLIDSMRDTEARILIEHFYDDVAPLKATERAALASAPPFDDEIRKELALGRTEGGATLNEQILRPALNLRGIAAGNVGEKASNSIPAEARTSIDFRLVPNETPEHVRDLVERHIAKQGFFIVRDPPDAATRSKRHQDGLGLRLSRLANGDGSSDCEESHRHQRIGHGRAAVTRWQHSDVPVSTWRNAGRRRADREPRQQSARCKRECAAAESVGRDRALRTTLQRVLKTKRASLSTRPSLRPEARGPRPEA
ncbi:MAG TPA: peptidase dimerization domain-containing protein [Thermoanaerobaculia bacterium]